MYWLNKSALVEDFRERRVDEKERFKYFLATFITGMIIVQLLICGGNAFRIEQLAYAATNLVAIVTGIIICYRANKKGDNTDFIARMICLGWPIGIEIAVAFSALFLLKGVIESLPLAAVDPKSFGLAVTRSVPDAWAWFLGSGWFWIGVIAPYYLHIYWRLSDVNRGRSGETALQENKEQSSVAEVEPGDHSGIVMMVMTIAVMFTAIYFNSLQPPEPPGIVLGLALPVGLICLLIYQLDKWVYSRK